MASFFKKNRSYLLLALIIILAAFLIFFRLDRADIQHDDATYAFRAIGYLDYMDNDSNQTTPLNWFKSIPAWSRLSFHDHPPLVFLIQHLFFKIFGISDFSARLPSALAGLGAIVLLYLLARKLYNENVALLASFILAISSYHNWASRIGYLEPIALFFILLTSYLFVLAFENPKKFIWFGISLGLTLLTKYTTFFIIPVIFFYVLFKDKKMFARLYFVYGIIIAFLIFSPVIFYNFKLYQTRGHFDLQFAGLFNQDMSDWPGMAGVGISESFLNQFFHLWGQFIGSYSLPMYLMIMASIIYLLSRFIWRFKKSEDLFIILVLFFLTFQFVLTGTTSFRFLSLFNPFLALVLALGIIALYRLLAGINLLTRPKKVFYIIVLGFIFGFELFYNFNTNIFYQAIGEEGKYYSATRFENGGFIQLEKYLIEEGDLADLKTIPIHKKKDIIIDLSVAAKDNNIFIYDPTLRWFSALWYFRRWGIYYRQLFIPASDLATILPPAQWSDAFKKSGAKNMYYIWGANESLLDPGNSNSENRQSANFLAQAFESVLKAEVKEIYNANNQLAFKIYKLKLN